MKKTMSSVISAAVTIGLIGRPATAAAQKAAAKQPAAAKTAPAPAARARDGRQLFTTTCSACHQPNGEGVPEKYPPLAGSEWVAGDEERMLRIVLRGLTGDVEVQGETFSGAMPAWGPQLNDADIAAIVTYVRKTFGDASAPPVAPAAVARVRKATASRKEPFTARELMARDVSGIKVKKP